MKNFTLPKWLVLTGALLAAVAATQAGTFTTDFNNGAPNGTSVQGTAVVDVTGGVGDGGVLKLTEASVNQRGSFIIEDLDAGQRVGSFTANFKARVGGGTENPSQGFSFNFASDLPDAAFGEGGTGTGLVVSFDTIDNSAGFGADGNDPGDAPGVIVKFGGLKVAAKVVPITVLRTGANFVDVEVKLNLDGTLDVTYAGTKVFEKLGFGYAALAGRFGFGSATADLTAANRDNHFIDDLSITTVQLTKPFVLVTAPKGNSVPPNASIEIQIADGDTVLNPGSLILSINGLAVPGGLVNVSKAGGVTTIKHTPAALFASRAVVPVTLDYADNSAPAFQNKVLYSFQILGYGTLPESFAVAAGVVDTSKPGFKLRVHQLEILQPGSVERAEQQLAGLKGTNIADLASANADGTFNAESVINFGESAAGLLFGNFQTDNLFPGIPGTTAVSDNFAVEAVTYLDLPAGLITLGVSSDDGFRVTSGQSPRDFFAQQLGVFDGNRGTADSLFSFLVTKAGIYPFRLLYFESQADASLEWFSVDAAGNKTLLNDTGGIKAYRERLTGAPPFVSFARPFAGETKVSRNPLINVIVTEDATTVSSIKLFVNGSLVTPTITKTGKDSLLTYTPDLSLLADSAQILKVIVTDNASPANNVTNEWQFTTGSGTTTGFISPVKGHWDFDEGNLKATVGQDLAYVDGPNGDAAPLFKFVTTDGGETAAGGVPHINGKPAKVVFVPYTTEGDIFKKIALRMKHGISPNGGGTKVNQWTLIMDIAWAEGSGFGGMLQTHDLENPTDADMFWRFSDGGYGKGCCSLYDGVDPAHNVPRGEWRRVVFAVDLAANPPVFAKYYNGFKHRQDVTGDGANKDGRFGLPPEVFLFGDGDDNERSSAYVNSIQVREGKMTDEEVAALAGPDAGGIPIPTPVMQWGFDDGTLKATAGRNLEFADAEAAALFKFGTTGVGDFAAVPNINGQPAKVIFVPYTTEGDIFKKIYLRVKNGIPANGGGKRVNQWTWIMDILWSEGSGFGSVLQTHDLDNPTDGDLFWRFSDGGYGKGCCSLYDGVDPAHNVPRDEWRRVVIAVDLAANPPVFAKYYNGFKHRQDVTGDGASKDGRFALPTEFLMFGDGDDNERASAYVNSIQFREGRMSDEEVAALGGPTADDLVVPGGSPITGQWDFDNGDLKATVGKDMDYIDAAAVKDLFKFVTTDGGATDAGGVPHIDGKPAKVIFVPYTTEGDIFKKIGLRMKHGAAPNGGGTKVNQWTLIMDICWADGSGFGGMLQTHDFDNPTDADMFWRFSDGGYGKGCCSLYDGVDPAHNVPRGEWRRVTFSVDLSATPPVFAKYYNGFKHRQDVTGDGARLDSRFGLPPEVFLFGDGDDNERASSYVNAIQFRNVRLTDEEVTALGGPSADGIPGVTAEPPQEVKPKLSTSRNGLNLTISWEATAAGFTLESKDDLNAATWTAVGAVANNSVSVQIGTGSKFYRLRK